MATIKTRRPLELAPAGAGVLAIALLMAQVAPRGPQLFSEDTLAWARSRGDPEPVDRLESLGPRPYADLIGSLPVTVGPERRRNPHPGSDGRTEMTATIWAPAFGVMGR